MSAKIPREAHAIIIGAMKCGTSSLFRYLQNHPEICPASDKEPEFFSENQGHRVEIKDYSDLWKFDDSVHKYALEASTGYTKYPSEPNVAKNIYDYGIKPKFIYIIRNPVDRISSHINYLDETWTLDLAEDPKLVETSKYFLQLEQYREYFPTSDILILDFDELRDNPRQVLQTTYEFLEISPDYFPEDYQVVNSTRSVPELEKRLRSLNLGGVSDRLPKPLVDLAKNFLRGTQSARKRTLTDSEKEFIREQLKEDMADLKRVYGFDVGKWGIGV